MKYCSNCQNSFPDTAEVCPNDGNPLADFDLNNLVGQTIDGKYEMQALLGIGGMGAVFRARHTFIGNDVAVKIIHPKMAVSDDVVERFLREARAAAMIDHPNAIKVTDFGKAGGMLYLVMEFIQGYSLSSIIRKQGHLAPPIAANIMSQVCAALDAAHSHNIIHRDLKPDNIMIKQNDLGQLVIKVLDFGIAKIKEPGESNTSLTREGAIIGTLNYMSPEQCRGEEMIDARSDIYSLGVVVFEMLTGKLPFTAPTPTGVAVKHIVDPPPSLRSVISDIPEQVDKAVLRALEKEPTARYRRAGEFASELVNSSRHGGTQRLTGPALFDEAAKGGTRPLSLDEVGDSMNLPVVNFTVGPSAPTGSYAESTTESVGRVNTATMSAQTNTSEQKIETGEQPSPLIPVGKSPLPKYAAIAVLLIAAVVGGIYGYRVLTYKGPALPGSQEPSAEFPGMILIKSGYFNMGSNDLEGYDYEKPPHQVFIDSFLLDETEVTNEQFERFVNKTGYVTDAEKADDAIGDWRFYSTAGRKDHPVLKVSWNDAAAYAKWVGKRLPTEAEWEYAARGGLIDKKYPWGDDAPEGKAIFGFADQASGDALQNPPTQPVKSNLPNGYGLYNMAGNASEWCQDWYDPNYYKNSPERNPQGPAEGKARVYRGGSWFSEPSQLRVAGRVSENQEGYEYDRGFRCAKDIQK